MMGSEALPELMAATVAQLSRKMRTVEPVRVVSQSLAAIRSSNRFSRFNCSAVCGSVKYENSRS